MTKAQYNSATGLLSTQVSIASFIIGTILLIAHLCIPNGSLFSLGLYYILIAAIINFIILIKLCVLFITQKNHQEYFAIKIFIVLTNLPIVFIYLNIVGRTWK